MRENVLGIRLRLGAPAQWVSRPEDACPEEVAFPVLCFVLRRDRGAGNRPGGEGSHVTRGAARAARPRGARCQGRALGLVS